jgi:hypothetical protein
VKVGFALFAVVLFWQESFIEQTHTSTMLPNAAIVALHKEITRLVSQRFSDGLLLSQRQRGARIFCLATDTPCDFFIGAINVVCVIFWGLSRC